MGEREKKRGEWREKGRDTCNKNPLLFRSGLESPDLLQKKSTCNVLMVTILCTEKCPTTRILNEVY